MYIILAWSQAREEEWSCVWLIYQDNLLIQKNSGEPRGGTDITIGSVQSLDRLGGRERHDGQISRDPVPAFSAEGHCE